MNLTYTSVRSLSYSFAHSSLRSTGLENFPQYAAAAKSRQSCPILCNPIDGSPPGSPVPGKSVKIVSVSRRYIFFSRRKKCPFSPVNCLFLSQKDQRFFQPREQKLPRIWNRNRICRLLANLIISRCSVLLPRAKEASLHLHVLLCSTPAWRAWQCSEVMEIPISLIFVHEAQHLPKQKDHLDPVSRVGKVCSGISNARV